MRIPEDDFQIEWLFPIHYVYASRLKLGQRPSFPTIMGVSNLSWNKKYRQFWFEFWKPKAPREMTFRPRTPEATFTMDSMLARMDMYRLSLLRAVWNEP